jgi:hypothetical protein
MAKKIKKPQRGVSKEFFRASDRVSQKIQAAITELDVCVSGFENRWGVDRLPELVINRDASEVLAPSGQA